METMPLEGTQALCEFCRQVVMLVPVPTQQWHWLRDEDPVDGGRHCVGGVWYSPALHTLHKPRDLAWMYDAQGTPLSATGQSLGR